MASLKPLRVLLTVFPDMDTLDLVGPLELLSHATYPSTGSKAFETTLTAVAEHTITNQGLLIKRHIDISKAYATLADYDILIVPGGGSPGVLRGNTEPIHITKAFAALPRRGGRERILMSVCTGSLFLAEAGVLVGTTATTHPGYYDELRKICGSKGETKVMENRFVVNPVEKERGLRVITAGGVSSGMDATLWLIEQIVGKETREHVCWIVQYMERLGEGAVL